MIHLLVFSTSVNPRIEYIVKIILEDLLGLKYHITDNLTEYQQFSGARINYSSLQTGFEECHIIPAGLLNERGTYSTPVNVIDFAGTKALFPVFGKGVALPFDIFSASFYMLSRYEEYQPYIRDEHGRFSAHSSLAHQKGFLQVPVVNVWTKELGKILKLRFEKLPVKGPVYQFIPTLDIDAAWAFRHKGLFRTIGGYLKDIRSFDKDSLSYRIAVMMRRKKDPFDTFNFMQLLHEKYNVHPIFFILFASYDHFDKNTPVNSEAFQRLIKELADAGEVGIHPSYASNSNELLLRQEIEGLSRIIHREVTCSRQHFLKLNLPMTYRNLLLNDITHDYTMGFAAKTGFRAGICTSFPWYDLEMESATGLIIHPFACMDGTLHDYLKIEAEGAMAHIEPLIDAVREVGGTFISLWHNESLSNWRRWKGWGKVYEDMLQYGTRD